jgi:hypothetical protein
MKKAMLVLVLAVFLTSSTCFGASLDPAKIVVPRDSGRIVETYVSPNASAPLLVYVQDIHLNYEAQKAEISIMEGLIKDYGIDVIYLEGTSPEATQSFKDLRNKPKDIREQAADNLLKEGKILGVDYLDIATDLNFTLQGVEDPVLYKKETEDNVAILGNSGNMSKLISTMQNIASNLKLHIYSKEMRDLDEKAAAYDKDEIGLVEYVKFVEPQAAANSIDVKAFGNVALFIDSSKLEGQIDFPAVEKERATVVDAIDKALTDKTKKDEFAAKGLKFRTGDISQGEYYAYLKDAAQAAKVDLTPYKNLTAYTQYITTYEKIDTTQLFKELDNLVNKIKEALVKTPEQKQLSQIDKGLTVLADMINTKLVPDEYNYYVQNKADFNLKNWLAFLKANSAKFNLTNPVPDDVSLLETNLPLLERFYSVSFDRDNAFVANMKTSMAKLNKDKAMFVAGGFHTPNMKKLLKDNGFSYAVIAPRVDIIKDYSAIYKDRAQKDLERLNKMASPAQATGAR